MISVAIFKDNCSVCDTENNENTGRWNREQVFNCGTSGHACKMSNNPSNIANNENWDNHESDSKVPSFIFAEQSVSVETAEGEGEVNIEEEINI